MPWVVELGGEPDFFARDTRVFDSLADFCFVTVCESTASALASDRLDQVNSESVSRVNVTITSEQRILDCFAHFVGLGLPCAQTNTWHFVTGVQSEHGS